MIISFVQLVFFFRKIILLFKIDRVLLIYLPILKFLLAYVMPFSSNLLHL